MSVSNVTCLLFAALTLTGCSDPALDARLEPLMQASLIPGRGLGELELGKTTLAQFIDSYGQGKVAAIISDEMGGVELKLASGQLACLFVVGPQFVWDHGAELRDSTRDLPAAMARLEELRNAPLASISVRAARDPESTHYQGQLDPGVQLFQPIRSAPAQYLLLPRGPLSIVAGMSPRNPEDRVVDGEAGLVIYYRQPKGSEPLDPELVQRMTIFVPDGELQLDG